MASSAYEVVVTEVSAADPVTLTAEDLRQELIHLQRRLTAVEGHIKTLLRLYMDQQNSESGDEEPALDP